MTDLQQARASVQRAWVRLSGVMEINWMLTDCHHILEAAVRDCDQYNVPSDHLTEILPILRRHLAMVHANLYDAQNEYVEAVIRHDFAMRRAY